MNTFKKKSLCAALVGVGVLGMVGAVQAVSVNPDGLGQVLIYPYYTVRANDDGNAYNSLLSVVNSTASAKAVKVRFVEGKNSREVLDFNLYLSKNDVWTAAVTPTADGGAKLNTQDKSCTVPTVPATGEAAKFKTVAFAGDPAGGGVERTQEGYVEIIEMADILGGSATETSVTHVNGVPPCTGNLDNVSNPDLTTGVGGLFGSMTLINVADAKDIAYEATALDAFFVPDGVTHTAGDHIFYQAGTINPNLTHVSPAMSTVVNGTDVYITDVWNTPIDAVSAVLMNESVYNEFVLNKGTASQTSWVITFPTKGLYYTGSGTAGSIAPTGTIFESPFTKDGACDAVSIAYWDREEKTTTTPQGFSPPDPVLGNALCWEANVVAFGPVSDNELFRSQNKKSLGLEFENGWAKFTFAPDAAGTYHKLVADSTTTASGANLYVDLTTNPPTGVAATSVTFNGIPMVGFAAQVFNNGSVDNANLGKVWASYAGRINHRFSKNITQP